MEIKDTNKDYSKLIEDYEIKINEVKATIARIRLREKTMEESVQRLQISAENAKNYTTQNSLRKIISNDIDILNRVTDTILKYEDLVFKYTNLKTTTTNNKFSLILNIEKFNKDASKLDEEYKKVTETENSPDFEKHILELAGAGGENKL